MFVTDFKHMMCTFPSEHDAFMHSDEFSKPATEFFDRVTKYALKRCPSVVSDYDSRFLLTAIVLTRFPIETLVKPEEPIRFTLLSSAWRFMRIIDLILSTCDPSEDDASHSFLDVDTSSRYLRALNEFHDAWVALVTE
jgi:hypothetical protein